MTSPGIQASVGTPFNQDGMGNAQEEAQQSQGFACPLAFENWKHYENRKMLGNCASLMGFHDLPNLKFVPLFQLQPSSIPLRLLFLLIIEFLGLT